MFIGFIKWVTLPMYSTTDVSGKVIDVQATFQPTFCRREIILAVKISILALSVASMGLSFYWRFSDHPAMWFTFLTNWGVLLSIGYFTVALIGQFYGRTSTSTKHSSSSSKELEDGVLHDDSIEVPQELSVIQRITLALFTMSLITELIVTLLFWVLVYSGSTLYFSDVYNHGGFLIALIIDGFGIHHYPFRFRQIVWMYLVFFLYATWSLIHGLATNIGNPKNQDNDPDTDDDALYDSLNWNERPTGAAILCLLVGAVAIPLFHTLMWSLSMLFSRRYI